MNIKIYAREKKYFAAAKDRLLVLLLAMFSVKGIFYAAYAMPFHLYSSPDDVGHISYVMYLSVKHDTPVLHETTLEKTAYESFLDGEKGTSEGKIYSVNTEEYEECGKKLNWIAQHPPLYYLYLLPFYLFTTHFTSDLSMIILAMRFATILLGAITILFLYRSMKLLDLGDLAIKCVMVCIVFSPAIQYYLTAIDNDAMVICLSTAAFYYFVKYIRDSDVNSLYIFAVLCGGITISKYTGAVILPVYALVYLWDAFFIKKKRIQEFIKQSTVCVLIFAVIITPVLIQNYSRYAELFPVFDDNTKMYDYSLMSFATESGYFNEIVSHIIYLTGWKTLITANMTRRYLVALILLCVYYFKSKKNVWIWLAPVQVAVIFSWITDMDVPTVLIISTVLCLLVLAVFDHKRRTMTLDREVCVLAASMLLFYAAVFFMQHYRIYLHRGRTGAMHGRYYYPLIAPFFFILFRKLNENKNILIKLLPIVLLFVNVWLEIKLLLLGIEKW